MKKMIISILKEYIKKHLVDKWALSSISPRRVGANFSEANFSISRAEGELLSTLIYLLHQLFCWNNLCLPKLF